MPKDLPDVTQKLVWTEELTRQDRAATQVESPSAAATWRDREALSTLVRLTGSARPPLDEAWSNLA